MKESGHQSLSAGGEDGCVREHDKQHINLLLLGETGVGKSTWINAFANYCKFESLCEAIPATNMNEHHKPRLTRSLPSSPPSIKRLIDDCATWNGTKIRGGYEDYYHDDDDDDYDTSDTTNDKQESSLLPLPIDMPSYHYVLKGCDQPMSVTLVDHPASVSSEQFTVNFGESSLDRHFVESRIEAARRKKEERIRRHCDYYNRLVHLCMGEHYDHSSQNLNPNKSDSSGKSHQLNEVSVNGTDVDVVKECGQKMSATWVDPPSVSSEQFTVDFRESGISSSSANNPQERKSQLEDELMKFGKVSRLIRLHHLLQDEEQLRKWKELSQKLARTFDDAPKVEVYLLKRMALEGRIAGCTSLLGSIYVVLEDFDEVLCYGGCRPYSLQKTWLLPGMNPIDIATNYARICVCILDSHNRCVWRIRREAEPTKVFEFSEGIYPVSMSVTDSGRIAVVWNKKKKKKKKKKKI